MGDIHKIEIDSPIGIAVDPNTTVYGLVYPDGEAYIGYDFREAEIGRLAWNEADRLIEPDGEDTPGAYVVRVRIERI